MSNISYLLNARKQEPDGCFCGFCGEVNYFVDDCGFFYITSPFIMYGLVLKPCCKECYWKYRDNHIRLYGLGDR